MKAILLMVGTELLNGGMVDTNSIYMAEELNRYGIEIRNKFVVGDVIEEIKKTLEYAKNNSDLVLISGGMGPTLDDLTKEAVAQYLNLPLVVEEEDKVELIEKFKKVSVPFSAINLKEAEKPKGSISFKNDVGMANGIFVDNIAIFPGVPRELYNLLPKFLKWYKGNGYLENVDEIYIKDLITVGIPESVLEERVKKHFTEEGIFYEFLVKDYGILLRFQSRVSNKKGVEKIVKKLYNEIGDNIYGEDNDRLETLLINQLKNRKLKFSGAESCTGGLLLGKLVGVPGSSAVLEEGVVTYSNFSKEKRLGVKSETLEKYGAVSFETAYEMARGLETDIGVSITGIAGPDGGTEEKPVGLVYIGLKIKDNIIVNRYNFKGDRNRIREKTVLQALFDTVKELKKLNL